ncbi:hypothetical protein QJQ45_013756 [Haematococcus lacustris]|nr:hypothetical protein QJQ45_013756 [Haematococcus lacustris]
MARLASATCNSRLVTTRCLKQLSRAGPLYQAHNPKQALSKLNGMLCSALKWRRKSNSVTAEPLQPSTQRVEHEAAQASSAHLAPAGAFECAEPAQLVSYTAKRGSQGLMLMERGPELGLTPQHLVDSRRQQHQQNGLLDLDNFQADRRKWSEGVQEQVRSHSCTSSHPTQLLTDALLGTCVQLFSWHFNVFEWNAQTQGNPLITMTLTLLEYYSLLDDWRVNRKTVETFLLQVEREYLQNHYHNAIHASDVTQTAAIIMQAFAKQVHEVPKMDLFCIIMASAVHDLGHLGVNNDFLINSRHPRATTYNDKSVNENFHISRAFDIARTSRGCDIFECFTFDEQKKCRKLMIDVVMATDMAIHFDLLKSFNTQIEAKPDIDEWQERNLVYQMIVHLADIANPSRPFPLARGWAERVIKEFCEQGDKEAAAGLAVSSFCNRATMNMPRAQLNFIDIFLKPTLLSMQRAAPDFTTMALKYLEKTIAEWQALEAAGVLM